MSCSARPASVKLGSFFWPDLRSGFLRMSTLAWAAQKKKPALPLVNITYADGQQAILLDESLSGCA